MALIECFECGNQVSESAATCPKCGVAIAAKFQQNTTSLDEVEKPTGMIKKFLNAKLVSQILITFGMWIVAILAFYAFNENQVAVKSLLWVVFIASIVSGAKGYLKFKKKYENQLSDVDTIALGVKKAKSPASYELIAIFMTFVFGGFWFIAYFIISLSSVVLAPLMTLYIAFKAVKSSK